MNWILSRFVWFMDVGIISLGDLLGIVNLALVVLAIVGIVNACKSKKENYRLSGTLFCSNKRKRVRGAGTAVIQAVRLFCLN